MTSASTSHKVEELGATPWWMYGLLGTVLVAAGLFVLGHLVAATVASAMFFGAALVVGGIFEIVHAFWTKGWGGFLYNLAVGALYVVAGGILLYDPVAATLLLTLIFAAALIVSGIIRMTLAFRYWRQRGWVLLLSGLIGIAAGAVILSGWPVSGLWVFGLCLGIDLLFYGIWWIAYALTIRKAGAWMVERRPASA
jgi:uncharacterized membrane protein HdeD (DUF308 family)